MKDQQPKKPVKESGGFPTASPQTAGATLKDDCFTLPPEGSEADAFLNERLERFNERWGKGELTFDKLKAKLAAAKPQPK